MGIKIQYPMIKIFILLIISVLSFSCYYDNKEELYPTSEEAACDTSDISYSSDIKPVLIGHCYECHDNEHAAQYGGNIKLEDYIDVKAADDSSLYGSIAYEKNYVPMPEDYMLDSCTVLQFKAWINKGADND